METKETKEEKVVDKDPYDVWFISDLHLRHTNILKHQPQRVEAMGLKDNTDIDGHDKFIVEMWLSTTKRNDHVYVLGDMILSSQQTSIYLLHRLKSKGCKIHLIVGNHDKSTQKLFQMFESIDLIKIVDFKKTVFSFLEEDFPVVMCHYPMVTWPRKTHGALHLFGHIHDNAPHINEGVTEGDLMLNVGLDTKLSNYGLINLKTIYEWYKKQLNGKRPKDYINEITLKNRSFVR